MAELGNKVENWDSSYVNLSTTYTEEIKTPANLTNLALFEYVYEDVKEFLAGQDGNKVLECGCGGARAALYLALRGYDSTCSDFAHEALRLARHNFEAFGAKGTFVYDDLLNSKLEKNSFDCIMSFGLLEHFEELEPITRCMTELIRPGGIHVHCIIPKKFSTQTVMDTVFFPYRLLKNIVKRDFGNLVRRSFRDFPHYENRFSAAEYCAVFEREGNEILKCQPIGLLFPFVALPKGLGEAVVKAAPRLLTKLMRLTDRTGIKALFPIAPKYYIVARKK